MKTALPSRQKALQAALLFVVLLAIAVLVYGDQVRNGGWIGDAWLTRGWYALYPHADFLHTVRHFLDLESVRPRPANAVFRVALNSWFGGDTQAWLTWQLVSCVCMCFSIYLLLREIGVSFLDAAAVSGLLLVFPVSTSLWLWSAIAHASLAIALGAIGFLLALRAFRAEGRLRWVLHASSLLLFVISILLYEVCLPAFLASVLLYVWKAPRRDAVARWLIDCLVLLPIALTVTAATKTRDQTLGGSISHAGEMAGQLPGLLFGRLLPLGSERPLAVIALLAVYGCGFVAIRRRPADDPVRNRLRFLFALTGSGIVVIVLGYLIYVPGISYYLPLSRGIGDRVNALAGIGWVICVYALAALVATLATMALRRRALVAALGTAALTIAIGLSWLAPIADESRAYIAANEEDHRVLRVIQRAIPDPPRGAAIWAFGQPVETAYGVPVFANYWNMSAAAALAYGDPHVRSFVALPGTSFECHSNGVVPIGYPEYPPPDPGTLGEFGSRYGRTYFVDTERGQFAVVDSRARCMELRQTFGLSPQLPPAA